MIIEHKTGHRTSTFKNYSSENKLLQELGDEMSIIISNAVQSKVSPFIRFMWEDQHLMEFVAICCHLLPSLELNTLFDFQLRTQSVHLPSF